MRTLKLTGYDHPDEDVYDNVCDDVFSRIDHDKSGRIVYHEYIKHTLRKALEQSTVKVINWFRQIDVDKNGVITRDEWRRASSEVGFQAPVESVDELFDEIDRCGAWDLNRVIFCCCLAAWLCGSVLKGQRSRVSLSLSCVQEQDGRDRVRGAQQGTTRWVARVEHDRPDEEHVQAQERRRSDEPLLEGFTGTHPPPPSSFLRPSHTLASSLCHLQRRERVSGEKGKQKKKTFKQMEEEEAARKV